MPEAGASWYVNNYANPKVKWQDYLISDKYLGTNRDFVKLVSALKIPCRYRKLRGGHE